MQFQGKTVVVTGGGSGMGRQMVLQLLSRGADVAAVDLNPDSLDETRILASAGDRLSTHVVNITDRDAVQALPDAVIAAHGAIDVVINNAGIIQPFVRLNELGYDAIERVIDVNLYGTIHMTKAFLPHLLERPEAHLANVSSMGAFLPVPGQAMYGASKAAVKLMTEGLYAELLETNVGVSVVMPGGVDTNITKNSGVTLKLPEGSAQRSQTLQADEAARIILNGIERGKLHIFVGSDSRMMNLFSRLAPKRATRFIQKQMKDLLDRG